MKYIDLGKSFNSFKKQFLMQNLKEQLKYYEGKLECLNELMQYIKSKTNLENDNISAIDLMENFIGVKADINGAELERIKLLIPAQN